MHRDGLRSALFRLPYVYLGATRRAAGFLIGAPRFARVSGSPCEVRGHGRAPVWAPCSARPVADPGRVAGGVAERRRTTGSGCGFGRRRRSYRSAATPLTHTLGRSARGRVDTAKATHPGCRVGGGLGGWPPVWDYAASAWSMRRMWRAVVVVRNGTLARTPVSRDRCSSLNARRSAFAVVSVVST